MNKITFSTSTNITKTFFTFYNEELKKVPNDIVEANIIAILYEKNNHRHIAVYERTIKNDKTKIFDIFEDEISNTKNEIGNFIKPTKIKTIFALKKAILFSMINN